ncbi:hypothetical protein BH11PSE10_BH11PSE10_09550 [soil metagenome]
MTAAARNKALATQARRVYLDAMVRGLPALRQALQNAATNLLLLPAEYAVMVARRDSVQTWNQHGSRWATGLITALRHAAVYGLAEPTRNVGEGKETPSGKMSLVDDDTIEREIIASRLALAMMDRASWEFNDLRTRMQMLEAHDDLAPLDLLRAQSVARVVQDAWTRSRLDASVWRLLQSELHEEFALLLGEAYHEVNRWLIAQGVLPEVDLRPFIRRTRDVAGTPVHVPSQPPQFGMPMRASSGLASQAPPAAMPQTDAVRSSASHQADEVMLQLQRVIGRQVPSFAATAHQGLATTARLPASGSGAPSLASAPTPNPATPRLVAAIRHAQETMLRRQDSGQTTQLGEDIVLPTAAPLLLDELKLRNQAVKQVLKQAADTPAERATIEIVAMMFQSILTEEHIPATVRVWFARLQMPVLRVAVGEPDFFATGDHPARRLIDRMGACVMGFNAVAGQGGPGGAAGDVVEREIKRVVQVVEAYPDTGRRVFTTVLTEFEKFLDHYFENENQASKKGVSLAQQVEQRETLAIQYTIELRKMLNEVPVQDGVREFLFQVWADVLAVTAVRSGAQDDTTKAMKRAAADLIWSASAKVSREERAEVIRRLPPLLKTLRDGMVHAGVPVDRQDAHVRALNNALAAAFTAKTAAIPRERLDALMDQLETLEAMLPEGDGDVEISGDMVRDLSGHESDGMEVVAEGGSVPTPAMLAWARELQVGSWYMLDYRGRNEAVQLAWRGARRHMALFVTPQGRGVLFPLSRMAAFLQAGLLLPAQDEALTVKATRNALAKLEVDPTRLLA